MFETIQRSIYAWELLNRRCEILEQGRKPSTRPSNSKTCLGCFPTCAVCSARTKKGGDGGGGGGGVNLELAPPSHTSKLHTSVTTPKVTSTNTTPCEREPLFPKKRCESKVVWENGTTWTPTVCQIMAFWALLKGSGRLFCTL